ncbi:MAG: hypothetical protein NTW52_10875 [Planctomycetota bacterium]|nr:hypothetical protein [Planctomycetota bacterium]
MFARCCLPTIGIILSYGMIVSGIVGCEAKGTSLKERESLHEIDHDLPPYWPSSMNDAATKIEARLQRLRADSLKDEEKAKLFVELTDLIEWTPEVAADTRLKESHWIPIYEASEAIRKQLPLNEVSFKQVYQPLEGLIQLLRKSDSFELATRGSK